MYYLRNTGTLETKLWALTPDFTDLALDSKVLLGIPRKYSLPFYGSHEEKSGYFYASKYSI